MADSRQAGVGHVSNTHTLTMGWGTGFVLFRRLFRRPGYPGQARQKVRGLALSIIHQVVTM
jgi:hypothetical protein